LSRYVRTTWFPNSPGDSCFQSFLANSFEEAQSGAIKLARYNGSLKGQSPAGLIVDPDRRLDYFAALSLGNRGKIEFVPKLVVVSGEDPDLEAVVRGRERFGYVVLFALPEPSWSRQLQILQPLLLEQAPLIIACVDRSSLAAIRRQPPDPGQQCTPDVVVFDESFVNHEVPFAAFTAGKKLFDQWHKLRGGAFHSTTYQPNTISCLHFMRCLEQADPEFLASLAPELTRAGRDPAACASWLGSLYSPFLSKAIDALGLRTLQTRTDGHYILAGKRKVFDGVAGVACSIRGHNPESYLDEIGFVENGRTAVTARIRELTAFEHLVPAVSGASAVEHALRLGLAAQFPRRFVLAFQGGFGGKTLLALTGTAKPFYKAHLSPLYEQVIYLNPFAADILDKLEATLERFPVAIVQLELIQAVGGVLAIPTPVLRYLQENKDRWGYLLFVDEVQTGMYRTGPFVLSPSFGLTPDLLTLGKGTSDMIFPFALTLYSTVVKKRLDEVQPELPRILCQKYDYPLGYKTVANVLRRAEEMGALERVQRAGALFSRLLGEKLASCRAAREIRVHGLLIAIELETNGWLRRWFKKRIASLYLFAMLQNRSFPLLVGYCQYEPHVLKLTPPLTITTDEIHQVCTTIAAVLKQPLYRLVASFMGATTKRLLARRWKPGGSPS
jgi:acetylornithine/succinyldiaminopimelate/putrescine aminotransferase